jgi:DNA polymerase-3 subunit epsilon
MLEALRGVRASGSARAYARARSPSPCMHWRDARYCVVDLEMSGLDPRRHEIISFAALPVEEGRIRLDGAVHGLARPTRPLVEDAIRVHGIRTADLEHAPPLAEAVADLLEAMTGRVLVAHHAAVERAFLGVALRSARVRLRGPIVDTALVARLWLTERDGAAPAPMSLGGLARACGLPVHSPHTAIGDALTTAQLFIATADHLDARRPQTVRRLARAGERLRDLAAYLPAHPPAASAVVSP